MLNRRQFLSLGAAAAMLPLHSQVTSQEAWQTAQSLPIQTQELYSTVHQGRLYVAGGIARKLGVPYFSDAVYSYDPDQDQWRQEPSLPEALHHPALVSTGDRLFAFGGFHSSYLSVWQMRDSILELVDGEWRLIGQMPFPQAEGVAAMAADGRIHIVTGQMPKGNDNEQRSDHSEITTHLVWTPDSNQWQRLAPIPTARNSATGGWIGDQLIVCGGRTSRGNLSAVEIYDLSSDTWRSARPLPTPQAGTAGVVVEDGIIVLGGEIFTPKADVFADVWRYRLSTAQWERLPDMRTPRHGHGAGLIGNKIYVVGGATQPGGSGTSDVNEVFTL